MQRLYRHSVRQPRRTMIFVYLLLLMLSLGIIIGLRNCSPRAVLVERPRQGASEGDTIDVAMLYAPLNYYLYDDTLGGFSYDLLRNISSTEKQPINFIPVTSTADAVGRLRRGEVDLIASLPVNSAMTGEILFTDSVYTDRLVLIYASAAKGDVYTTPFQLAGKKIHLDSGSAGLLRLKNLQKEIGDTIFTEQHPDLSGELIAMKVAHGDFEFGVVNSRVASDMQSKFPQLKTMPVGFTQLQAWAVADSTMLRRVNNLLHRAYSYPATSKLRQRYKLSN